MKRANPYWLVFGAAGLFACDTGGTTTVPPPAKVARALTAQEVTQTASKNSHDLALGVLKSAGKFSTLDVIEALDLEGVFPQQDTNCEGTCPDQSAENADNLAEAIGENFFNARLVETANTTDTKVTYKLDAKDFCGSSVATAPKPFDPNNPNGEQPQPEPEPTIDEECAQRLADHPIRLAVESFEAGSLSVHVLVDAAQTEVALVEVGAKKANVTVNLGTLNDFLKGVDLGDIEVGEIQRFTGKVAVSLEELAALDYKLTAKIEEAIDIATTGDDAMALKIAASASPFAEVRMTGEAQDLSITAALARVDATIPLRAFGGDETTCTDGGPALPDQPPPEPVCTTKHAQGSVVLYAGNLGATVGLSGSTDKVTGQLRASGSDLATATYNGAKLVSLGINQGGASAVDFTLTATDDNLEAELTPALAASLLLNLTPIAEQMEVPGWANNETFGATLDHAKIKLLSNSGGDTTRPVIPGEEPQPEPAPQPSKLVQLLAGSLNLTASSIAQAITVNAGQCLIERLEQEGDRTDGHPFTRLTSGSCD